MVDLLKLLDDILNYTKLLEICQLPALVHVKCYRSSMVSSDDNVTEAEEAPRMPGRAVDMWTTRSLRRVVHISTASTTILVLSLTLLALAERGKILPTQY